MALTTLALTKAYLDINANNTDLDSFLTEQLTLVSDAIEGYTRRSFASNDYVQTFYFGDYPPSRKLELFHYPVSAIASIVEDSVTLDTSAYRFHKPTGIITRSQGQFFRNMYFHSVEQTVVTYTAGLTDVPPIVLGALYAIIQERYTKKISGVNLSFGPDVQRVSIPGTISIDFDFTLNNNERKSYFGSILGSHMNTLDYYRSDRAVLGEGKLTYVEDAP